MTYQSSTAHILDELACIDLLLSEPADSRCGVAPDETLADTDRLKHDGTTSWAYDG